MKLADNQDKHKISNEFETGPYCTIYFGVTYPLLLNKAHISPSRHARTQVSNRYPMVDLFVNNSQTERPKGAAFIRPYCYVLTFPNNKSEVVNLRWEMTIN